MFVFACLGLLPALALPEGDPVEISNLIERSPFLPPGFEAEQAEEPQAVEKPQPVRLDHFEYRSYAAIDGVYRFSIYDTRKRRGAWLEVGESSQVLPLVVTDFDRERNVITVKSDGQVERLSIKPATTDGGTSSTFLSRERVRPSRAMRGKGDNDRQPPRRRIIVPRRR